MEQLWRDFGAALDDSGLRSSWAPGRDGQSWDMVGEIEGVAVVIELRATVGTTSVSSIGEGEPAAYRVVVSHRVSSAAREALAQRDIGFYDGQGHLRLWHRPLMVDTRVAATGTGEGRPQLARFNVPSMLDVALAALDGLATTGVRAAAARIGRSPGTVSKHLAALRRSSLISERSEPTIPDLFEAVLDVWRPRRVPLAELPRPGAGPVNQRLQLGFEEPGGPGWTLASASAAAAWGAPVAITGDAPPDFYVPNEGTLRQARTLLGDADFGRHACTVAVGPASFVCRNRYDRSGVSNDPFLAPSAVVAALDLAADPARGRETLDLWSRNLLPEVNRVW